MSRTKNKNLYVYGDPDNGPLIKKAFEDKGFNTSTYQFINPDWLYYTLPGERYVYAIAKSIIHRVFEIHPKYIRLVYDNKE